LSGIIIPIYGLNIVVVQMIEKIAAGKAGNFAPVFLIV
jgi:hypothetical protein